MLGQTVRTGQPVSNRSSTETILPSESGRALAMTTTASMAGHSPKAASGERATRRRAGRGRAARKGNHSVEVQDGTGRNVGRQLRELRLPRTHLGGRREERGTAAALDVVQHV